MKTRFNKNKSKNTKKTKYTKKTQFFIKKNYIRGGDGTDESNKSSKLMRVEDLPYSYDVLVESSTNNSNNIKKINTKVVGQYSGPWKYNEPYGKGKFVLKTGAIYEGSWVNGKPNGDGRYTFTTSGNKFAGEFKDGHMEGNGVFTFSNGDKYVGEFKNGEINGNGTFYYTNGNKYVGEFKKGFFEGKGVFTFVNGDKYTGEFKENRRNGYGVFEYVNGNKYEGQWKNGMKDGIGTLTTRLQKYTGLWKNGAPSGEGKMDFFKTGVILKGIFRNITQRNDTILYIEGTAFYPDGSTYIGLFANYEKTRGKTNPPGKNNLANNNAYDIRYGFDQSDPISITDTEFL